MRKTAGDVSLSDCIETGKDGNALSLMDVLCSDEDLFEDLSARQTYRKLYEVMDTVLSPRERMVITLRYGLGDRTPLTQREIAAKCGISRSYVSRIEKKALAALQQALQGYTQEVCSGGRKKAEGLPLCFFFLLFTAARLWSHSRGSGRCAFHGR